MQVANVITTCTARQFHTFNYQLPHQSFDDYDRTHGAILRRELHEQLNLAKQHRIVNVFAFIIAQQEYAGRILEEFGFTCSADYNNYKYPDTSRFLRLYSRDMNTWDIQAAPAPARFTAPLNTAPQPVQPVGRLDRTAPPQLIWRRVSHVHRGAVYNIQPNINSERRSFVALTAQRRNGRFWTTNGGTVSDPFPLNRWVDWHSTPNLERPPALQNVPVSVQLRSGRVAAMIGDFRWNYTGNGHDVVRVMRIGDYPA